MVNKHVFYSYIQSVTHQCFCFPNSQWGTTALDKRLNKEGLHASYVI